MSDEIWYAHFNIASIHAVGAYIKKLLVNFGKDFLTIVFSGPTSSVWFSCRSEPITIVRVSSLKNPGEILEDFLL